MQGEKSGGVVVDESRHPMVELGFPTGSMTDDDWYDLLDRLDALRSGARRRDEVIAVVVTGTAKMTPGQRKIVAQWMNDSAPDDDVSVGSFVVLSAAAKGVLTALTWLSPRLKKAVVPCATREEAVHKAQEALALRQQRRQLA